MRIGLQNAEGNCAFFTSSLDNGGAPLFSYEKVRKGEKEVIPKPLSFSAQLGELQDMQTEDCPSEIGDLNRQVQLPKKHYTCFTFRF